MKDKSMKYKCMRLKKVAWVFYTSKKKRKEKKQNNNRTSQTTTIRKAKYPKKGKTKNNMIKQQNHQTKKLETWTLQTLKDDY